MPKFLNRTLYLGYYFKQLDRSKYQKFLKYASETTGIGSLALQSDMVSSVYTYNVSLLEYFQFGFYKQDQEERKSWAGTGYMYEYQLFMNPKSERHILDDKRLFFRAYEKFILHEVADREMLSTDEIASRLLQNKSGKLVLKSADGKCGAGVQICKTADFTPASLIKYMKQNEFDLAEAFIVQHPAIQALSPAAVNTVRIFSQLNNKGEVELLGSRLRISVNSPVDNMAAGNMAAPIDEASGMVCGPGVYSDITKEDAYFHPVTGIEIPGFQIPFWKEMVEMVKKAHLLHPQNRSIGWDIVVTDSGPGFIEGNHDWCKLLWQLPVKKGLKYMLEPHLTDFNKDIK